MAVRRILTRLLVVTALLCGVTLQRDTAARHRASAAPGAVSDQLIGVVTSFFPADSDLLGGRAEWNRLAAAGDDVGLVAMVDRQVDSSQYRDFVEREQAVGQKVLGSVRSLDGEATMLASAAQQKLLYGINGILLQNYYGTCPGSYFQPVPSTDLIEGLRALGLAPIVIQTTFTPQSCYQDLADVLLRQFTSPDDPQVRPPWLSGSSPKLWNIVNSVPANRIEEVVAASKVAGADYVATSPTWDVHAIDATNWSGLRAAVRAGPRTDVVETFPAALRQRIAIPVNSGTGSLAAFASASAEQAPYAMVSAGAGPGTVVDPTLAVDIADAQAVGRKVLGFVQLDGYPFWGKTREAVLEDVRRWRDLYGVNGIYVDGGTSECSAPGIDAATAFRDLARDIRQMLPNAFLAYGAGRNIAECLVGPFDAIVDYFNSSQSYPTWTPSRWQDRYPDKQFWQIVMADSVSQIPALVASSKCHNADMVYVTAGNWITFDPTSFASLLAAVNVPTRCAVATATAPSLPRTAAPVTPSAPVIDARRPVPAAAPVADAGAATAIDLRVSGSEGPRVQDGAMIPADAAPLRHASIPVSVAGAVPGLAPGRGALARIGMAAPPLTQVR